jgi:hypothetical protein
MKQVLMKDVIKEVQAEACDLSERASELVKIALKEQKKRDSQAVMDLFYALREINGKPNLKDLVKLAKRIKS